MRPLLVLLLADVGLAGCGAVARPFRVAADVVRVVPVWAMWSRLWIGATS
jgi:hypothetical protein